jgi:hypothetical protein
MQICKCADFLDVQMCGYADFRWRNVIGKLENICISAHLKSAHL